MKGVEKIKWDLIMGKGQTRGTNNSECRENPDPGRTEDTFKKFMQSRLFLFISSPV